MSAPPKYLRELLCLAAYFLLALWWTWPLALHFTTHIAGGHGPLSIGDNLQFAWNFDHVPRSWAGGRSALTSRELFAPHPASLALHTMQWHHSALSALARWASPAAGLPALCNGLMLATLAGNAFATRLLCRHVLWRGGRRSEWAPFAVGAAAAFGPLSAARSFGHWNLLAWGYLPLFMLSLARLDEATREDGGRPLPWALASGACLALAGWCDVQFALFGGLLAAVFFVATWGFERPRATGKSTAKRVTWWALALGIGGAMLAPLLRAMLKASAGARTMPIWPEHSLDVADLLSPSPWHPLLGGWAFGDLRLEGIEWVVSPGLVLLLLGAWGWKAQPRAARPWAWSALALWLLACGPRLQVAHRPVPALFSPTVAAKPPQVLEVPTDAARPPEAPGGLAEGSDERFRAHLNQQKRARREAWRQAMRMPFSWLRQWVGPLKSFRAPARISIAALCCWSVCAALGLGSLGRAASASTSSASTSSASTSGGGAVAVLGLVLLFECWRVPLPSFDARPPRWAGALRSAAGAGGVVPLPIAFNDWRTSWAMWGQTIHRRPLWNAYLSRGPRLPGPDPVRDSALWRGLSSPTQTGDPLVLLEVEPLPSPSQAARDLSEWRRRGLRFLLWQRQVTRPEDEARARRLLEQSRRVRLLYEEPDALLWEIVPDSKAAASGQTGIPSNP